MAIRIEQTPLWIECGFAMGRIMLTTRQCGYLTAFFLGSMLGKVFTIRMS